MYFIGVYSCMLYVCISISSLSSFKMYYIHPENVTDLINMDQ